MGLFFSSRLKHQNVKFGIICILDDLQIAHDTLWIKSWTPVLGFILSGGIYISITYKR